MQMLIRDATLGDLPSTLSIYNYAALKTTAGWTDSASDLGERQNWFDARRKSGFPVLVVEASQQVIGFDPSVIFGPGPATGTRWKILSTLILPSIVGVPLARFSAR